MKDATDPTILIGAYVAALLGWGAWSMRNFKKCKPYRSSTARHRNTTSSITGSTIRRPFLQSQLPVNQTISRTLHTASHLISHSPRLQAAFTAAPAAAATPPSPHPPPSLANCYSWPMMNSLFRVALTGPLYSPLSVTYAPQESSFSAPLFHMPLGLGTVVPTT